MRELSLTIDLFPSPHPIWKTLLEKPPDNVVYKVWYGFSGRTYLMLTAIFPRNRIIHFCNGVKLAYNRRWVADMESAKVLFKSYSLMENPDSITAAQERLETGDCAALLPLTNAAKRTLERILNLKRFHVKVIYPTFYADVKTIFPKKRDLIIFIGGSYLNKSFEAKGGREVFSAWLTLYKMYPSYKLLMITKPPQDYLKIAKDVPNLQIINFMPREKLLSEVYPRSKIIVLTSMMDTVGYSVIEAMNYGVVPIVSDHFAFPEIVGDSGFIVNVPVKLWRGDGTPDLNFYEELANGPFSEIIEKIADAIHVLLSDEVIWERYSHKSYERMINPPFNIDFRNEQLRKVYEIAIGR